MNFRNQKITDIPHRGLLYFRDELLPVGDFGPPVNKDKIKSRARGSTMIVAAVAKKQRGLLDIPNRNLARENFVFSVRASKDSAVEHPRKTAGSKDLAQFGLITT